MTSIGMMPSYKNSSLTKHGAHKINVLLKEFGARGVLKNLWGSVADVHIDSPQAKKNLSAYDGVVPLLWDDAAASGDRALNGLVFMAIVLSHADLVNAMKKGASGKYKGEIVKGDVINHKAFTNFKHTIEELGFSSSSSTVQVSYDLEKIFTTPELPPLARALISKKINYARSGEAFDLKEAVIDEELGKVFSVSQEFFSSWLFPEEELMEVDDEVADDIDFFLKDSDSDSGFVFKPGHSVRKTGSVLVKKSDLFSRVGLRHNYIQNKLYEDLVGEFGKDCVGTEQLAPGGKLIDLVVKNEEFCWFYEIKTAESSRLCIRQALPQLLEYAYWGGGKYKVDRLLIVAEAPITEQAEQFLSRMRDQHSIPVYYLQFIDRES